MLNARERGLSVALVGDRTWTEMFGPYFSELRQDPPGVAMEHDFNDKTFRDAREILAHAPNAMVLHFVTPDHRAIATAYYQRRTASTSPTSTACCSASSRKSAHSGR